MLSNWRSMSNFEMRALNLPLQIKNWQPVYRKFAITVNILQSRCNIGVLQFSCFSSSDFLFSVVMELGSTWKFPTDWRLKFFITKFKINCNLLMSCLIKLARKFLLEWTGLIGLGFRSLFKYLRNKSWREMFLIIKEHLSQTFLFFTMLRFDNKSYKANFLWQKSTKIFDYICAKSSGRYL